MWCEGECGVGVCGCGCVCEVGVVASGLAQVSKVSFVLGSRARRLGLVSREVSNVLYSVCQVRGW